MNHYWTPAFRSSVFGSYARVDYPGGASALGPFGNVIGLPDFTEWRVGANTFWLPASGLVIGAEVMYVNANTKGRILAEQAGNFGSLSRLISSDSAIEGRLRLQRDF